MSRAAGVAASGLVLILFALLFSAAPLFVPGLALTFMGLATPAWISIAARGVARRAPAALRSGGGGRASGGDDRGHARALGTARRRAAGSARRLAGVAARLAVAAVGRQHGERAGRGAIRSARAGHGGAAFTGRPRPARARLRGAPGRRTRRRDPGASPDRACALARAGPRPPGPERGSLADRAAGRRRGRRPAPLPGGHPRLAHPLAGARARSRAARAATAGRR